MSLEQQFVLLFGDHKPQSTIKIFWESFLFFYQCNYGAFFKERTHYKKNFEGTYLENANATFNNFKKM
jgi:hypothetical protein